MAGPGEAAGQRPCANFGHPQAQRYGRTPAQILLRWHIELGLVPVPKSEDPQRLRENIAVFDFTLEPEDVARLSALDRGGELVLDPESFGH